MRAELRAQPHAVVPGATVIEVWYRGEFIAEIVPCDGPGVRVISKYPMATDYDPEPPGIVTVAVFHERGPGT